MNTSNFKAVLLEQLTKHKIEGIVFDLDGTLFSEFDYTTGFCEDLHKLINVKKGDSIALEVKEYFLKEWRQGRRRGLFENVIDKFSLKDTTLDDFVATYSSITIPGGLNLFPWAEEFLASNKLPSAILTNGNPNTQRNKFRQLQPNWVLLNTKLYCANEYAPKPSPEGIQVIADHWGLSTERLLFVGDSDLDSECATNANCKFVRFERA